ncbi:hypothetical protein BCON_0034g00080 [Botryotinia convoluta]|uniref:Uncharacterized protein n=1 Tax=Botryotinia convoluta TaxID=54673 RepID=A0A4Z1IGP4_9HELO|nr:hypothetical protein BCON_0034g00080 [Botryotinia convoluta]
MESDFASIDLSNDRNAEFGHVIYSFATFDLIGIQSATRFLADVPQLQLNKIRALRLCHELKHPILTDVHFESYSPPAFRRQQKKDYRFLRRQREILVDICRKLSNMKG